MLKKILKYSLLMLPLLLTIGCSRDEQEGTAGEIQQKPNWVPYKKLVEQEQVPDWTVDNSVFSQSMTATIALDESIQNTSGGGIIAAFAGDECVGVAENQNSYSFGQRYYLYIKEPQCEEKKITIAYYSKTEKNVRYWVECINYATDKILGTVSKPFILKEKECLGGYSKSVSLLVTLPKDICTFEPDDEIAVFVGDECRVASISKKFGVALVYFNVPVKNLEENAYIRYYSSQNHHIYTSQPFPVDEGMVTCKLNP